MCMSTCLSQVEEGQKDTKQLEGDLKKAKASLQALTKAKIDLERCLVAKQGALREAGDKVRFVWALAVSDNLILALTR